jgi:hypothetical protein
MFPIVPHLHTWFLHIACALCYLQKVLWPCMKWNCFKHWPGMESNQMIRMREEFILIQNITQLNCDQVDLMNIVGEFGYLPIHNFGAHFLSPSLNNCNCKPHNEECDRHVVGPWLCNLLLLGITSHWIPNFGGRRWFTFPPMWNQLSSHFATAISIP